MHGSKCHFVTNAYYSMDATTTETYKASKMSLRTPVNVHTQGECITFRCRQYICVFDGK